jgi:hypothetical protein
MYGIICITVDDKSIPHYGRATKKLFSIDGARDYRNTVSEDRKPLIISDIMIEQAIELNNKNLAKG